MASMHKRSDGRYEIRESQVTDRGPRSRTLAIFRELDGEILEHARSRARKPFDMEAIVSRARELGIPYRQSKLEAAARYVAGQLARGATLPPALAGTLARQLGGDYDVADTLPPMLRWLGATDADRGDALEDLMRLADRMPPRPHAELGPPWTSMTKSS